ncbi:MAG TPA: DUF3810 domain-containing protein [Vicinamibacteria bacterium]
MAPHRKRAWRRALLGLGLLATAIGAQLAARSAPAEVERLFSRTLYPHLGGRLGHAAGVLPFSLAEVLVLGAVSFLIAFAVRAVLRVARGRDRPMALLVRTGSNALLLAGGGYALFLLLWGFNYSRLPLATSAGMPVRPAPPSELADLASALVLAANEARVELAEDERGAFRIAGGFGSVALRAAQGYAALGADQPLFRTPAARPKRVLLSSLLSRVGITGIYFPFSGEPNLNTTVPDSALPFSTAHELAHQQGFAREDEANFVGYLACRRHPDPDFRYSGLLAASHYAIVALHHADPSAAAKVMAARSAAVLRDEAALREWADRYRGPASEMGERVNDAYLRTQGQRDGVRSYGRMVDLLLAERRAGSSPLPDRR